MRYATNIEGAKAYGKRLNISPKHAMEVCTAIRGRSLKTVETFLQNVQEKKVFVPFKRFKKQIPHRKGGQPGRYPVKAARAILRIVKSAEANADEKGMDTEKLVVGHAAAHKGNVYDRRAPKGRSRTSNIVVTNVEIILREAP